MSRVIVRDFIAYLPARVVPAMAALLGIPIVTRLLSPGEYGSYLLALTSLTLIGSFSSSWLVSIVVRFRPVLDPARLARLVNPILLPSSVVGVGLWVIVARLYGRPLAAVEVTMAGSAWIVSFGLAEYAAARLRADERAVGYSVATSLRSIGGLASGIALAYWVRPDAAMVLLGTAFSAFVVVLFITGRRRTPSRAASTGQDLDRRSLLRYGIPIAFSNLFVSGLSFANRYVIEHQLGVRQVAVYGAAYDIAEKSIFFLNAMMLLSSSVMAVKTFEAQGQVAASRLLSDLIRFYLLIGALIVSIICALSGEIVAVVLPPSYAAGAIVLPVVAFAAMLVGIMHRYSLILSFYKRTDVMMLCTLAALAINLATCWFATRPFGIMGGALGCLCGYAAWFAFVRLSVRRYSPPSFPWRTAARVLLASGAAVLAARWGTGLVDNKIAKLCLGAGSGGMAYVVLLLLTGELSRRQMAALASPRSLLAR